MSTQAAPVLEHSRSNRLISAAIVVAALYFGREILLPFAIAVLLSFLLSPLVERLESWKFGRIPAVIVVVLAAFSCIALLTVIMAYQVYDLANKLPSYKENIVAKAQSFQGDEDGVFARAAAAFEEIQARISPSDEPTADGAGGSGIQPAENPLTGLQTDGRGTSPGDGDVLPPKPTRVEVIRTLSAWEIVQGVVGPILLPLASAGIVTVFVIFMLLKREDLRNRFIHLVGGERLNSTTQALDDAASRVSRYLLMQLIINAAYGLVICVGLAVIGLPNAILWGVLTAVLRFVPYAGPWIAAVMPIAISLAVFDGWVRPVLVLTLFIVNELISNNFLEPWLYGSSTGISTLGILVSAVFWTWLWGPAGLILATPLTVCVSVIGRYVPQLAFLNTMLSDDDALAPHARFYQRLLAADPEEAIEVADDFLASHSLEDLYGAVLLPALALSEQDRHHGKLDEAKQQLVHQTTREIVEDLGEKATQGKEVAAGPGTSHTPAERASVLCLPARDEADEIVGLMLVQLLEARNVTARVVSTKMLSGEMIDLVDDESAGIVCVSALPPFAATHARFLCKRLKARLPQLRLVVGLWQAEGTTKKTQLRLNAMGIDKLVTTLTEAVSHLERLSQNARAINVPVETVSVKVGEPIQ